MHKYVVSNNRLITPSTLLLSLKKDPASKPFSFQPGQYAAISFKRHGRPTPARCFSIVSSPTDQDILQFSMRTKGHFTKALASVVEGDEVIVRGAFGGFVFDATRDTEAVLLAGGIGITPFMSMIQYATATHLPNDLTLVFSCQTQDDVPFAEELKVLEKSNPHFKTVFVIGEGQTDKFAGQAVASGHITPEIIDYAVVSTYSNKSFFICGPPPFMNAMTKVLKTKGVPANRIMTEAFSQGPNRQTGKIRSWPLNVYALGAVGIALSSFAIMVGDLLDTLPPSSFIGPTAVAASTLASSRQTNLDQLVNALSVLPITAPATIAVNAAMQQSNTPTNTPTNTPNIVIKPTPVANTPPYVAPAPKCTTTQSGVTTCV